MNNIDNIRKACVEANQDDNTLLPTYDANHREYPGRKVRLTDVLRAVKYRHGGISGNWMQKIVWPFIEDDDLEHQSEETLNFLASLLNNPTP
jgi:hypothetical protein